MGLYLAHTAKDGRTQTVLQHLTGTAKQCAAFADTFHAPEQGQLAGSAHDVGKYSDAFQRRLLHDGPKVDHATAGAFECLKLGQLFAAFAVAGHHGGLPDGGGRGDGPDAGTFFGRINRAAQGKLDDYSAWKAELTLPRAPLPDYLQKDKLAGMFFTRMLFSCLVDADYTDTGEFMDGQSRGFGGTMSMEHLWERLQTYRSRTSYTLPHTSGTPRSMPSRVYTASMPVRMEYSVVKIVSRGVSANWPIKAKLTAPSGTTSGRSPLARGIKKAVI